MAESNYIVCGTCGQKKLRITVGSYGPRNKKYMDEHGLVWNGKKYCGVCNLERVRTLMAKKRESERSTNSSQST